MSQHEVELCALLVDETYGELTSRMFTILLRRGRLTIKLLQEHTQLNRRQLRHGLALLIQQNLVYHFFEKDTQETLYEANKSTAYGLIRSGKFMEVAETKYGSIGLDAVRTLLLLGQATVADLVQICLDGELTRKQKEHTQNGGVNGFGVANGVNGGSEQFGYSEKLEEKLFQLREAGYIESVTRRLFRSPTDTRNEIEKDILKTRYGGSTKGTKQKDELKQTVRSELQALRADDDVDLQTIVRKRRANGNGSEMNGHSKRMKYSHNGHEVNGDHSLEYTGVRLERDLLLRINYEKFTVTLRNDRLVQLVHERIGYTTSRVYAEVLRLMEDKIPRCQLDPDVDDVDDLTDGPSITTMQLSKEINEEGPTAFNFATGIGKASSNKINNSLFKKEITKQRLKVEEDLEEEAGGSASSDEEPSERDDHEMNENGTVTDATEDSDDHGKEPARGASAVNPGAKVTFDRSTEPTSQEAAENRMVQLKNHLMLLATDSCRFLRRCGLQGRGQWTVDYDQLVAHLRETEVNLVLFENFGLEGHRLVRMMRKLGKLDEKMLPNTALMSQKDIRTKLAEMQMAGMVEVQCIPRDAQHTVNRSIYLWFFDADRVSAMLLQKVYKTMSRCIQRLEIERRRASGILSLAARSDVQGNVEEVLNGEQLNLLQKFEGKEEMLVGQLARLDELVGIFRDY